MSLRRYTVVDVGHSFVRRSTAAVMYDKDQFYKQEVHYRSDIQDFPGAARLARRHNVDDRVTHMFTVALKNDGDSVLFIQDIVENIDRITRHDPDFVLVHIASNEIANMRGDLPDPVWRNQIWQLVDECKALASQFPRGVTVCFMEVVPRVRCRGQYMTGQTFERYATYFNRQMAAWSRKAIKGALDIHPGFRYAKARGWRYEDVPGRSIYINGQPRNCVAKPLRCMLGRDLIHPTLSTFRSTYSRCIERAIKEHKNWPGRVLRH